ncbi:MAG: DUF2934 domain-containing protein [Blastocatellia bacterium]
MTRESIEELRARLLRDPEVQSMIRMRAYEIYRIRGQEPGRQAEDWFQAQGEVLKFLIEEESRQAGEDPQPDPQLTAVLTDGPESIEEPSRPVEHTAANIESESSLGVWSATEPESAKLAPPIGKATEFQIDGPKQSSARKKTEGGTAKKTTRRASAKKDADSPKPKRTRKKASEPKPAGNE